MAPATSPDPLPSLFVTDLDGTLLWNATLSPANEAAVRRLCRQGVHVALATGKHPAAVEPFARRLGLAGPHIVLGGAALFWVTDPPRTELLSHLPRPALCAAQKAAVEEGIPLAWFTPSAIWVDAHTPQAMVLAEELRAYAEPARLWEEEGPPPEEVAKVLVRVPQGDPREERVRHRLARWGPVVRSAPTFVDLVPAGLDKGVALEQVRRRLGIPREGIWAAGDAENDVPLLAASGHALTWTTSPASLRRLAQRIWPPGPDALARALEELWPSREALP